MSITDFTGRPLKAGDRVKGWYDDVAYTGTVTEIHPHQDGDGNFRNITVQTDSGTAHPTYSDAVVVQPHDGCPECNPAP